jgi:hypothetical protein
MVMAGALAVRYLEAQKTRFVFEDGRRRTRCCRRFESDCSGSGGNCEGRVTVGHIRRSAENRFAVCEWAWMDEFLFEMGAAGRGAVAIRERLAPEVTGLRSGPGGRCSCAARATCRCAPLGPNNYILFAVNNLPDHAASACILCR